MSNKPRKQSSYKDSLEFAQIAKTVGEVDDFVLQEFLTDIIDSAPDASGVAAPKVQHVGEAFPNNLRGTLGSADFGAEMMTAMNSRFPPVEETDTIANDAMYVDSCVFVPGTAPVKPAKKSRSRRASRASDSGADDEEPIDAETRRKRQREANLQAQRRCRERHRNRVANLEQEVEMLRADKAAALAEVSRLQIALQQSLNGLEECQARWQSTDRERANIHEEKAAAQSKLDQTLEALRKCAVANSELKTKLDTGVSDTQLQATEALPVNGPDGADGGCAPCMALRDQILEASKPKNPENGNSGFVKLEPLSLGAPEVMNDESSLPLQDDAAYVAALAESDGGATQEDLERVALRLTKQFRAFLVDGNACSTAGVFSVLAQSAKSGEAPPCGAMSSKGRGQTESVFRRAHELAKEIDLTESQRVAVVKCWKEHAARLNALFERRKKLTADALVLQGTSPVATLVDFLNIGSGALSGVASEEDLVAQGGKMTLTGFAVHACRLQGVISELRQNIGAEQMQNFVLVSEVVSEVLTPLQTCKICAAWGSGCPDMLAISRAMTVQTMELMPHLASQ